MPDPDKDMSCKKLISLKTVFYFGYGAVTGIGLSTFLVWQSEELTLLQSIAFCVISGLACGLTFALK
ncbi:hypothetical protein IQ268_20435 [Oculatella sp. LEGE 06141]|uniref:hypothetical protein n=1 Tax=Oculatella sp. LEGE 06141 TaxID=1828648 RepID=UPI001880F79A|nr:hypothetical protein [Oculatella sp. LEGE 06141]MBE9180931.1 hypothetical protein [Oculatella sp. LEGE 06141]